MAVSQIIREFPKRTLWSLRFSDREDCLVYVHIGKCGGATLWSAIRKSDKLAKTYKSIRKIHIEKPPILKRAKYVIVVRNPIKRAVSAFNWRYKLVVEDGKRKAGFDDEPAILTKYQTINTIAEQLYSGDTLNDAVAADFRKIHHLHESISFYLTDLLKDLRPEQVAFVLATETLDADTSSFTGLAEVERIHENANKTDHQKKTLSETARANLKRFLEDDYKAVKRLLDLSHTTQADRNTLLA